MKNFIYLDERRVVSEQDLLESFNRFPEEIRLDFADSVEEYIYQGVSLGKLLEVKPDEAIKSGDVFTPSGYCGYVGIDAQVNDSVSIAGFDETVADKFGKWNYPLNELSYLQKEQIPVVLVRFADGCRFCEV